MKLEHYPPEKLKNDILAIVGKFLDLGEYKVFFFGSRVNGKSAETSDVDVGIEGPTAVSFKILSAIEEDIGELPTLYKIEIVDFGRVAPKFKEVAKQNVEAISQ